MRLIDKDSLELDAAWDDYYDGYTAYSQFQIDNAITIDAPNGWIRCNNIMPNSRDYVLFVANLVTDDEYREPYKEVMKGYHVNGYSSFWFSADSRTFDDDAVDFWRPIPQLPYD